MKMLAVATAAALVLSGCAVKSLSRPKATAATPAAVQVGEEPVGGIIGGGLIMNGIGADLNRRERRMAIDAEYRALESTPAGQPVAWRDERSGRGGTVTAAQPYRVGSQDCRPYSHTITANGSSRTARGTACRNPDGSWTLLN